MATIEQVHEALFRIGSSIATELDEQKLVQLVTDEATALVEASYGAFFWNALDARGEVYMLYTLSGAPREAFANFRMPRATPIFAPTFKGEGVIRSDDIRKDPRFGAWGPQPDGHLPVVSYLAVPVVAKGGQVLGGLFFSHREAGRFTALHERITVGIAGQAAVALSNVRLYNALKASERRKDEFLAILGHELRNPLAPIVTALDVMKLNDRFSREGEIIERHVKHLGRLVDDLLDLSRISTGKLDLKRSVVAARVFIERAVELASPLFEERHHRFTMTLEGEPSLFVDGDEARLAQVFANLLTNAARYTDPNGEVSVTARRDGDDAVFVVADNGAGISPELLPHVFDAFVQGSQTPERAVGGLGLGLSVVKSIVDMHGGRISIAARARGGTEVTVRLPAMADAGDRVSDPGSAAPSARAKKRILVVDDNEDAAELLAELLTSRGHSVTVAHDGPSALAIATRAQPDVCVLDIGLPVMDGYEVAAGLRARFPGIRLIALTGYGQAGDRARAEQAGFDVHLVKPVDFVALENAL